MTRKAHDALKASIRHWKRMAAGKRRNKESPTADHCALCKEFQDNFGDPDFCTGCPVSEKTKLTGCLGTPFSEAWRAWRNCGGDSPEFKAAARKEIEFLESLLPKRKKK